MVVMVLNAVFNIFQCTCPCFPGVLLISTRHNIISKPLAAFAQHYRRNKWTAVREERILSQLIPSILGKNIGRCVDRTSDLPILSPIRDRP